MSTKFYKLLEELREELEHCTGEPVPEIQPYTMAECNAYIKKRRKESNS